MTNATIRDSCCVFLGSKHRYQWIAILRRPWQLPPVTLRRRQCRPGWGNKDARANTDGRSPRVKSSAPRLDLVPPTSLATALSLSGAASAERWRQQVLCMAADDGKTACKGNPQVSWHARGSSCGPRIESPGRSTIHLSARVASLSATPLMAHSQRRPRTRS